MSAVLRRLRGMVGLGASWASVWSLAGLLFGAVNAVFRMDGVPGFQRVMFIAMWASMFAVYGFIIGGIWSAIFAIAERRQTLQTVSVGRVAVWGAVGGCLVPVVVVALHFFFGNREIWREFTPIIVMTAWLGAGCAAATINVARRAEAANGTATAYSDRNASVG